MECYEGATMIKTFRGLIVNADTDTIALHTNDGSTGYRIVKFDIINQNPATQDVESVVKIYSVKPTTETITIDFSDNTLLAAGHYTGDASGNNYPVDRTIIFDNMVFNQDIYVTCIGDAGNIDSMNYYLELEQVKLDLNENTVATLKNLKNLEPGG